MSTTRLMDPEKCDHKGRHVANVTINNIDDTARFTADVRIWCADCGMPFRFTDLPDNIISTRRSNRSYPLGEEARLPLEPMDMDGPVRANLLEHMMKEMPKGVTP